ncbi:hypothetical protein PSCFBP2116_04207 [Pseudomonas syringae]|uniref:Uncharacterized protein n=1 Tax=Pseudomonas syringae TaxID=317 RepID=A0A2K4WR78_PSESX|nr:hypothetical protein CFBP3840_01348 [Pseudomonas syringae]SPD83703.1 hypothetical protein PSCFBP2116_04207 [Pseudomonas syringae]
MFDKGIWLNEPRHWNVAEERLTVTTSANRFLATDALWLLPRHWSFSGCFGDR